MILVSSSLGIIGRELVFLLIEQGLKVRAMVPNDGGARHLKSWLEEHLDEPSLAENAEFAFATFEDADSVSRAMVGIESAILILPSIMDEGEDPVDLQRHFFQVAQDAGVKRMVNLSGSAATSSVSTSVGNMLAAGEMLLEATGMEYTHLRFPLFMLMQNIRVYADMIRTTNQLLLPLGARQVAMIDARDIAEVAAVALTQPGHSGKSYMLTGPSAINGTDVANALTQTRGIATEYIPVLPTVARQILEGMQVPKFLIDDALALYAEGQSLDSADVTDTVEQITGKPPRTIAEFTVDYEWAWGVPEGQLNGWNE